MTPLVEIQRLTKRFESITAVDDVSFSVNRGEVLGFLGPNGAGKSTTMEMIAGFLTPDEGSIQVNGDSTVGHPISCKRHVGYLPEGAPLYGDMSTRQFLGFVGEIRGFRSSELVRRVDDVVQKVNLQSVLEQPIETLSKGFKRRVGIAQAILHDPDVLVLDEPTDGLDPNQKHEVRNLIREMSPQKAIILSTHILEEVDAVCTRAIIIAGGKVVADGNPLELRARSPRHNTVTLSIRSAADPTIASALENLAGVAQVRPIVGDRGLIRLEVIPENASSIAEHVSSAAREHDWQVEEMYVQHGRLEEVFREVTDIQQS